MAELDNIQNQLHLMLRQYVENKRQTGETIVGGEIPYPTLIVFVGNKICNEALNGILPEMKRHWPTSFASSGMGRLLYLLIDRNSDLKIEDECGEHCSLTSPNPLKSLADNTDDCGAINKCIRNLCLKGNTIKDVKDMRIVAVTDVGDADSLITGEVLALSRQFCKMLLNQTTNEGELFAFLPHNITVSEVEYNQSYEFFVKWKDWNDSKGEFPRIFMRFENSTKRGPVKDGIPAVCHTMIFDSVDNRGIPVTDGWRNRLMVDVLELSRPMDTESIHTPGEIEKTISKEYILLKAMDPANWAMPLGYEEIPWESADTGDEECPAWTVEYDGTCYRCHVADYEHHVTAAVAYGLYDYVQVTGDEALMEEFGLELLLETARFWVSRMVWNDEKKQYEILQVTGPDEWHEPVDNNAYTNRMAKWNIETALSALSRMREKNPDFVQSVLRRIHLTDAEMADWRRHAHQIYLHDETGLIEQFDGYFDIPDAIITEWDEHGMPRMPASCVGKKGMQRPILKQADVVMLMKLLPDCYDEDTQRVNFEFYERRTLHRSSLSSSMHALMGARLGLADHAYRYLERSSYVDLDNNQRNIREGLHAASMGGTWQAVVMGYCGLHLNEQGEPAFAPHLPPQWKQVRFCLNWRGKKLQVTVKDNQVSAIESI